VFVGPSKDDIIRYLRVRLGKSINPNAIDYINSRSKNSKENARKCFGSVGGGGTVLRIHSKIPAGICVQISAGFLKYRDPAEINNLSQATKAQRNHRWISFGRCVRRNGKTGTGIEW